jgi:hypothetical protein
MSVDAHAPPVQPSDYRDHRPLTARGLNLWENHGWMIWDRPGGEDILLWLSPYRLVGRQPGGPFAVDDVALSQTLLLRGRFEGEARRRLADTPFLAVGYDLGDHLPGDALSIAVDDERATWQIADRVFTAAPPRWTIRGEHAGVDVDLELTAMGPPFWLADPATPVEDSEERWFTQCARARGTVRHNGTTFHIDGYASHERHVHCGTRYDPPKLLAASGVTWHSGSGDGIQVIALSRPSLGRAWARLVFDDAVAEFRAPEATCRISEVETWVDPASRLAVPSAWHASFSGPAGSLEIEARAYARAYYLWPHFSHGATVLYWWLADAQVGYELADGRRGRETFRYVVHDNRLLYRRHVDD